MISSRNKIKVKICGLKNRAAIAAAINNGADFLGFVFFDKSPRNISPIDAKPLCEYARALNGQIKICAVCVNPDDEILAQIKANLAPDYLQLHGDIEIARINEIKSMGFRLIMAFGIGAAKDLENADKYSEFADFLLFDAQPPKGSQNAGGFGVTFDWGLLSNYAGKKPWFLSGGLNPTNVKAAIAATNAPMIDVSSGVESVAGVKDLTLIETFLKNAKGH